MVAVWDTATSAEVVLQDMTDSLLRRRLGCKLARAARQLECLAFYQEVHWHYLLETWVQVWCPGQLTNWEDTWVECQKRHPLCRLEYQTTVSDPVGTEPNLWRWTPENLSAAVADNRQTIRGKQLHHRVKWNVNNTSIVAAMSVRVPGCQKLQMTA